MQQAQHAGFTPSDLASFFSCRRQCFFDTQYTVAKESTGRCQANAASLPFKQDKAQFFLKQGNLPTEGWLGDKQDGSGLCEAAKISNGQEGVNLF